MIAKAKILIIDDEEDICNFSKSILERTGKYEVVVSTKPMTGVNLARVNKPDLILLDIVMPEMDGSKVAEYLLHNDITKNIPIAFLTSIVKEKEVTDNSGMIGGRPYISKPVTAPELVSRVEMILNPQKK